MRCVVLAADVVASHCIRTWPDPVSYHAELRVKGALPGRSNTKGALPGVLTVL